MGRYADYLRITRQMQETLPESRAFEAAAHAHLGEEAEARRKAEAFVREFGAIWVGDPAAGPKDYVRWVADVSNAFTREEERERLIEGLRLAGLPT